MVCPECGGETRVINSVAVKDCVLRERMCTQCHFKTYTTEKETEWTATRKRLNRVKQLQKRKARERAEEMT